MAGPPARSEKPFNYPARAAATFEFANAHPTDPAHYDVGLGRHCSGEDMTPRWMGKAAKPHQSWRPRATPGLGRVATFQPYLLRPMQGLGRFSATSGRPRATTQGTVGIP